MLIKVLTFLLLFLYHSKSLNDDIFTKQNKEICFKCFKTKLFTSLKFLTTFHEWWTFVKLQNFKDFYDLPKFLSLEKENLENILKKILKVYIIKKTIHFNYCQTFMKFLKFKYHIIFTYFENKILSLFSQTFKSPYLIHLNFLI